MAAMISGKQRRYHPRPANRAAVRPRSGTSWTRMPSDFHSAGRPRRPGRGRQPPEAAAPASAGGRRGPWQDRAAARALRSRQKRKVRRREPVPDLPPPHQDRPDRSPTALPGRAAPRRRPAARPVISFRRANRTEGSEASSQPATMPGKRIGRTLQRLDDLRRGVAALHRRDRRPHQGDAPPSLDITKTSRTAPGPCARRRGRGLAPARPQKSGVPAIAASPMPRSGSGSVVKRRRSATLALRDE